MKQLLANKTQMQLDVKHHKHDPMQFWKVQTHKGHSVAYKKYTHKKDQIKERKVR